MWAGCLTNVEDKRARRGVSQMAAFFGTQDFDLAVIAAHVQSKQPISLYNSFGK